MVEESFSGFKKEGAWEEVVEHGEKITDVLRESGVENSDLEEWEDWRPKRQEGLNQEMAEKTAEKASVKTDGAHGIEEKAKDVIKGIEKTVYEKVMAKSGHQYFENELISANIKKSRGKVVGGNEDFSFEVDIHEEGPKENVRDSLTEKH